MKKLLLLALPLAVSACGGGEDASDDAASTDRPSARTTEAEVQQIDYNVLVVSADGVGAMGQEIANFGTQRADVEPLLSQAYGSDPERSENTECGGGAMQFSSYGPLRLSYQGDKLVGWTLGQGNAVATSDGVQPGTTPMSLLREKREVRDITSSLEGEFEYTAADYGTIGGFAEDGQIISLHAGMNCFFR